MKSFSQKIFPFIALAFLVFYIATPFVTNAQGAEVEGTGDITFEGLIKILRGIACFVMKVGGGILVLMIVFASIMMSISGSDSSKYELARKTLVYSLIGALVVFGMPFLINITRDLLNEAGWNVQYEGFDCTGKEIEGVLGTLYNTLSVVINAMAIASIGLFIISILWGAIAYMVSVGDPWKAEEARTIIIRGVIGGIIIFAIAWLVGWVFDVSTFIFG